MNDTDSSGRTTGPDIPKDSRKGFLKLLIRNALSYNPGLDQLELASRLSIPLKEACDLCEEMVTEGNIKPFISGKQSKKWRETICCPKCGEIEKATVEFRAADPFPIYVHKCRCGYTITESEWETVVV